MSYSTSRDGFARWEDMKKELGLSDRHPSFKDPDKCLHDPAWRMGTGAVGGAQESECCTDCGIDMPEDKWIMWKDDNDWD